MTLKVKIYLSVVIFLILNLALIFFLRNLFFDIKETSSEILSQREKLLLLEEKAKNSERFASFFQKEEENFERLDSFFINPEMPVGFIDFLEKTSRDYILSLKIASLPLAESKKDPWSSIGFQLSSLGSFSNFLKFSEKLKFSPYLIELLNLNISRIEKTELLEGKEFLAGDVKAELSIKVYTQ